MYTHHQHQKQQHRANKVRPIMQGSEDISGAQRESREVEGIRSSNGGGGLLRLSVDQQLLAQSGKGNAQGAQGQGKRKKRRTPKKGASAGQQSASASASPNGAASGSAEASPGRAPSKKSGKGQGGAAKSSSGRRARSKSGLAPSGAAAEGSPDRSASSSPPRSEASLLNALLSPTHFRSAAKPPAAEPVDIAVSRKLEFDGSPPSLGGGASPSKRRPQSQSMPPAVMHQHQHYAGGLFQNAPQASDLPIPDFEDSPLRASGPSLGSRSSDSDSASGSSFGAPQQSGALPMPMPRGQGYANAGMHVHPHMAFSPPTGYVGSPPAYVGSPPVNGFAPMDQHGYPHGHGPDPRAGQVHAASMPTLHSHTSAPAAIPQQRGLRYGAPNGHYYHQPGANGVLYAAHSQYASQGAQQSMSPPSNGASSSDDRKGTDADSVELCRLLNISTTVSAC